MTRALNLHENRNSLEQIPITDPRVRVEGSFVVPRWFADQQSWVAEPFDSNSLVYNLPICLHINGCLDCETMKNAIAKVQERHSVLRSIFSVQQDCLIQAEVLGPPVTMGVIQLDNTVTGDDNRVSVLIREAALQPFLLTRNPALRATMFSLAPDKYILLITVHHLICDDWSTGILVRDLLRAYESLRQCGEASLNGNDSQYCDFIRWQEKLLMGNGLESRLTFWEQYLAGRSDFHYLKPDRPRPQRLKRAGCAVTKSLDAPLTSSLVRISQQSQVSLFMTMLAAFQCILYRRSGDVDIAVGSCAANRSLTSFETTIGRFANDLIVRTNLGGNPTFRELMKRVRHQALLAYSHQDVPFAGLLRELSARADRAQEIQFQVMFILQDALKDRLHCPGLTLHQQRLAPGSAKYDLCVFLHIEHGLEVTMEYDSDIFDRETIEQLLCEYENVLIQLVNTPEARVDDFDTLTTNRKNEQLYALSRPSVISPNPISRVAETDDCTAEESSALSDDQIESKLLRIWERSFGMRGISREANYFELGGDSLLAARLFAGINHEFKVSLPLVTISVAPTIRTLARALRHSTKTDAQSLVALQTGGTRLPLFCAHGQSGNLLFYRNLALHLGPDQPVYGFQPRALDGKHIPLTSIREMASSYIEEMRSIQNRGPYFLAGFCMGGGIAFEMAQQLKADGESIGMVAMLDSYNVGGMHPNFGEGIIHLLQTCWFGFQHFLAMDRAKKLEFVKRHFDGMRIPESEVSRINTRAALSYYPKPYSGRLLQIHPEHRYALYEKAELAWNKIADDFELLSVPCYPGQMFEGPFVRDIAQILRSRMDQVCGGSTAA